MRMRMRMLSFRQSSAATHRLIQRGLLCSTAGRRSMTTRSSSSFMWNHGRPAALFASRALDSVAMAPPHAGGGSCDAKVMHAQRRSFSSPPPPPPSPPPPSNGGPQNLGNIFQQMTNPSGRSYLEQFTVDLTEMAKQKEEGGDKSILDPIIGRHDEIRRCLQILGRRQKNNPILIGQGILLEENEKGKGQGHGILSFANYFCRPPFLSYVQRESERRPLPKASRSGLSVDKFQKV